MDCAAFLSRVTAGITWWREGHWCWTGNGAASGASTCSQPGNIGCSGCSRMPPCGSPPAGDASPSDTGFYRGLPLSGVPANDSPPGAPSCVIEKRSRTRSGPANTENWVRRFNPWAPMEWPRSSPCPAPRQLVPFRSCGPPPCS